MSCGKGSDRHQDVGAGRVYWWYSGMFFAYLDSLFCFFVSFPYFVVCIIDSGVVVFPSVYSFVFLLVSSFLTYFFSIISFPKLFLAFGFVFTVLLLKFGAGFSM